MMKKQSVFLLAAVALMGFAIPAQAQTTLYVAGGASFPTGDFGDAFSTGWMAAGGLLFGLGDSGFGVGGEVFYGQNNAKDEYSTLFGDAKVSPYGVMAIADYSFGSEDGLQPYLFGGLGLMVLRVSGDEFESDSESKFGYQFGAGLSFPIGLFVEGRYMGAEDANYFAALAGWAFGL
jgi:opacity protein-like surface antigen